ncbi:MAG TPA: hypothetical protein VLT45_04540 [Kofleriaceae bacterium]|nr:hypothetical protein [Kofleriaceae bacterium]
MPRDDGDDAYAEMAREEKEARERRNQKRRDKVAAKAAKVTAKPKPAKPMKLDDKLAAADRLIKDVIDQLLEEGGPSGASQLIDAQLLINASRKDAKELREAVIKLARCAVFTLQANGKPGIGSGLVISETKDGKRTVERWDKQFIDALALVGIEVVDKPRKKGARRG